MYSFGIVMFEVYAGQMAFQGANLGHLIFQIGVSLSSVAARCVAPCSHDITHRVPREACLTPASCNCSAQEGAATDPRGLPPSVLGFDVRVLAA